MPRSPAGPRILHLDIETTPNISYTWGTQKQYISPSQIAVPSTVLCWSAKWHDGKQMFSRTYPEAKAGPGIKAVHALLDEADAVCHYNGIAFDIPRLNQEFQRFNLGPPSPAKQIDLFRTVASSFSLPSNKLEYVAPYFKVGKKAGHAGFSTWTGCMNGDERAWRVMERYNRQDVRVLEGLYRVLLPWVTSGPNLSVGGEHVCVNCGAARLQARGRAVSRTLTYQRYQCLGCGKWQRERLRDPYTPPAELVGLR